MVERCDEAFYLDMFLHDRDGSSLLIMNIMYLYFSGDQQLRAVT